MRRTGQSTMMTMTVMVWFGVAALLFLSSSTSIVSPILQRTDALLLSPSSRNSRISLSRLSSSVTKESELSGVFDADLDREELIEKARKRQQEQQQQQQQKSSIHQNPSSSQSQSAGIASDDPEWKFFDTARINVSGGDGGNGCVAFRREKGEPMGGPNGGKGGNGGNVWLLCDQTINTLAPLRNNRVHVRAKPGKNGLGKNKDGKMGDDVFVKVPPGTVVRDLKTQQLAGELRAEGDKLLVARGGRGGRGNRAFMTPRRTAPKLSEKGEPGASRWLSIELRLVADVGFLGMPSVGKSSLLAAASNAKPKIASYDFTTITPNLAICDLDDEDDDQKKNDGISSSADGGSGLVLCDIPGLIEGASHGAGLGLAFLRHVQRCKVLLHVVDGTSEDPVGDFRTINEELKKYDQFLAEKPQVVVINKMDIPEVQEKEQQLIKELRDAAGHSRVLSISAATTLRVKELMKRLKKFVRAQPDIELPPIPEIDLSRAGLDYDSDDFEIKSDPSYPGQWRVCGEYVEQIAKMTHWEYPEAVARFGRQLEALGISAELERLGAEDGDLVMVDEFDFDFNSRLTSMYIPQELLERDAAYEAARKRKGSASSRSADGSTSVDDDDDDEDYPVWRPFPQGGFLDVDTDELQSFMEAEDWELLDGDDFEGDEFILSDGDEVWTSS
mmetsp:Transcript_20932/g.49717  ORF Transcript_20932/g.49717 Transcript_20932/m.49717 type:complete len:672 (+) Transcript_20932:41-2056(+)